MSVLWWQYYDKQVPKVNCITDAHPYLQSSRFTLHIRMANAVSHRHSAGIQCKMHSSKGILQRDGTCPLSKVPSHEEISITI